MSPSLLSSMCTCRYTYICTHMHTYTCTHTHIHTYIHAYIHTYIHIHLHTYIPLPHSLALSAIKTLLKISSLRFFVPQTSRHDVEQILTAVNLHWILGVKRPWMNVYSRHVFLTRFTRSVHQTKKQGWISSRLFCSQAKSHFLRSLS